MTFSNYSYTRPDFKTYKQTFLTQLQHFQTASDFNAAEAALQQLTTLRQTIFTMAKLAYIRHSIQTDDPFYQREDDFWNDYQPVFDQLHNQFYQALLDSPFQAELSTVVPHTLFLFSQDQLRLLNDEVIPLKQQENELISQYTRLIASAQLDFQGQIYNLAELSAFFTDPNQSIRKAAQKCYEQFFVAHEEQFDSIFAQLVSLRNEIALKSGFDSYVAYADCAMNRWGYTRTDLQGFRQFILKEVVPLTQQLYQKQAQRLGLDSLDYYDLPLTFSSGNPKPAADQTALLDLAQKMYHQLSSETGQFFDTMLKEQLLDLTSRPQKQSGGYCEYLDQFKAPFIFANFNGTSDDIDVLTHEAGHAFQTHQASWITAPELIFPTSEAAEIHSMSMEFLTYPFMEQFFSDSERYRFAHLSSALAFLPYGALVDHFQEEVYSNPEWTPKQRKDCWRKLEKQYCPERNYQTSPAMEQGIFWYRQGHIFEVPFYYIDYTLAQVCAFQFLLRAAEQDPKTWEDYLTICQIGGSQSFLEIVQQGHLTSPFELVEMKKIVQKIYQLLEASPLATVTD